MAGDAVDENAVQSAFQGSASSSPDNAGKMTGSSEGPLANRVAEFERATVLAELERHQRHVTNTAKALGLERSHFYKKCQQLGIQLNQVGKESSNG